MFLGYDDMKYWSIHCSYFEVDSWEGKSGDHEDHISFLRIFFETRSTHVLHISPNNEPIS